MENEIEEHIVEQIEKIRSVPVYANGIYSNPEDWGFLTKKFMDLVKWGFSSERPPLPSAKEISERLPVTTPNTEELEDFVKDDANKQFIQSVWIGHSTFLIQMEGKNILTDPVFYDRCSPISFLGPKRYTRPSITLDKLPNIDIVIVSHDHYDHLDINAIKYLAQKSPDTHYYCGKNMHAWFVGRGCRPENVHELTWWESHDYSDAIKVVSTPCQHWTKRTLTNTCKALWGSFAVIGQHNRFYFAGDTGYCPGFKQIGDEFGPFDAAFIPIGAYRPRWFMKCAHINPKEAVLIHQDIKSKLSVGMHWGTFVLTDEHIFEPPEKLQKAKLKLGVPDESFVTVGLGEICTWKDGVNIRKQ